ncbi:MAG: sialidase family protein [Patescibacteria group bacterium]
MTQRIHIFFYTLLVLALIAMTGVAAFLFGKVQNQPEISATNNSAPGQQTTINSNTTAQPTLQNDLAEHDTWVTFSADPASFSVGTLIAESASVPDVLVCPPEVETTACQDDELLVYFVNTEGFKTAGDEQIALIRSTDGGKTWSDKAGITIQGKESALGAVDPSVVMLDDGSVRLYFFGSTIRAGDPASAEGEHVFYSALSTDGLNFTLEEGQRLSREKMTDPEVVGWNGLWYMLYSVGPNSGLAVSSDGLSFEDKGLISPSFGGVPGLVVTDDGLLGYGCQMGISSSVSTDGLTFTKNSSPALQLSEGILCDPAVDRYKDEYVMVYKTAPAQSGNQQTPNGAFQNQNIPPLQQ